jgi:hypothetical protein
MMMNFSGPLGGGVPTASLDILQLETTVSQPTIFNLACIECQHALPLQPVPMFCCLRMICKPCIKRKAKELLTMPLKKKQ